MVESTEDHVAELAFCDTNANAELTKLERCWAQCEEKNATKRGVRDTPLANRAGMERFPELVRWGARHNHLRIFFVFAQMLGLMALD